MVHRPGDTQLLAQLIKHEKDYAAAFQALAVASASSRDSLSAYAAASPAPIARPIAVLVGALAAADDALTGYRESFEEWREHLHRLKELEDELAVVLRDRQILINRVIKVSKSPRPAAGSASQTSGGSGDAKVGQAQAELRACEAYLVDKEREHEAAWARAMRDGLRARCKALVDYGWHCAEKGKDALHALDDAATGPHTLPPPAPPHNFFKPLPDPRMNGSPIIMPTPGPGSDNSSLTPSQSASQTDHGAPVSRSSSLSRPHDGLPTNAYPQPHPFVTAPTLNRPIVEEPEQTGSSSEDELASGTLRVVENHPRQSVLSLQSGSRHALPAPPAAQSHTSLHKKSRRVSQQQQPRQLPNGVVPFPHPGPAPAIPRAPSWSSAGSGEKARKRATSFSFLGSISSMFGHRREPSSPSNAQGSGPWATRTDARLRRRTNDSSDEERANWASDGGGALTRSISRGSVRSRKNSEEPSKTYIRANKPAAGGFAFSRSPSVKKNGKNALSGSPRSSSDVGPSSSVRRASADRAAAATASMRRNVLEANHGPSLMSIVEGTQNPSRNSTLRRDGSVSKRRESVQVVATSSSPRQPPQEPDRAYQPPPVRHEPVTREAEARMGPLRSALRNGGNRSPSPASVESPARLYAPPSSSAPVQAPSSPLAGPSTLPPVAGDVTDTDSDADSFETGHETLLGDSDAPPEPLHSSGPPRAPLDPNPPQAPRPASPPLRVPSPTPAIRAPSPLPAVPPKLFAHDLGNGPGSSSSSTLSNSGATVTMGTVSSAGTARRKSVRMVLPPDFAGTPLPTPTAEPAASGWHSRTSVRDVWDDSSEDDGGYQHARAALAQADRKLSKAGEPEEPARKTRTRRY